MRGFSMAMLAAAVLGLGAAPASALTNWTQTWIDLDFGQIDPLVTFEFDTNSEFSLTDFDPTTPSTIEPPSVLIDPAFDESSDVFAGLIIEVLIPNFFDPLPTKLIDVQFVGSTLPPCAQCFLPDLPRVLDIIGADAPFSGPPGPALPVLGAFESASCTDGGCVEHWVMHPNPDFETVKVFVPVSFSLTSLHIVTQSVPEPSTLLSVGTGLFGLFLAGRRRSA